MGVEEELWKIALITIDLILSMSSPMELWTEHLPQHSSSLSCNAT